MKFRQALDVPNEPLGFRTLTTLTILALFLMVTPWYAGLFFTPSATIVVTLLLLGAIVALFRDEMDLHPARPALWVLMYGAYAMLTNLWATSVVLSLQVTLTAAAGAAVFVVAQRYGYAVRNVLVLLLLLLNPILYVFGMGAAVSWWSANNAVYGSHLLASVFQYHNTYGAVALAITALGLTAGYRGARCTVWNFVGTLAFTTGLAAVVGTYSRVVWVYTPFVLLALFISRALLFKRKRVVWYDAALTLLGLASGYVTVKALQSGHAKDVVIALALLLVGSFLAERFLRPWVFERMDVRASRGVGIGLVALLLLGGYLLRHHLSGHGSASILQRLHAISFHSVSLQERFYYYKNALAMWLASPLFGSGGNAWMSHFQAYQTLPYWSKQVHSVLFDQLLDGGVVQLLLFGVSISLGIAQTIRVLRAAETLREKMSALGFLLAALILLTHAFLDFDFSYAYYEVLFWMMLGLAGTVRVAQEDAKIAQTPLAPLRAQRMARQRRMQSYAITVALLVFFVFGGMMSGSQVAFGMMTTPGYTSKANLAEVQTSTALTPYDDNAEFTLAKFDYQMLQYGQGQAYGGQALAALRVAAATGAWDPSMLTQCAVLAYQMGDYTDALNWSQEAIGVGRFNQSAYENAMAIKLFVSARALKTDPAGAKQGLRGVTQLFQTLNKEAKVSDPALFPAEIPLTENATVQVYEGLTLALLGQYKTSESTLNPFLTANRDQPAVNLYLTAMAIDETGLKQNVPLKVTMQEMKKEPGALQEYQFINADR